MLNKPIEFIIPIRVYYIPNQYILLPIGYKYGIYPTLTRFFTDKEYYIQHYLLPLSSLLC